MTPAQRAQIRDQLMADCRVMVESRNGTIVDGIVIFGMLFMVTAASAAISQADSKEKAKHDILDLIEENFDAAFDTTARGFASIEGRDA